MPSSQLDWLRVALTSLSLGTSAVQEYGRAKVGSRSIVDPLDKMRQHLEEFVQSGRPDQTTGFLLESMAHVTRLSAESTAQMVPRVGRASYVDASTIRSPDAGAMALSFAMDAIYMAYTKLFLTNTKRSSP